LNRSTEDGKVKLNIRSETDIQRQAMRKVTHQKSLSTGRKYTSKVYYLKFVKFLLFPSFQYRGVHQTFPTRRWEAQFRKGGKVRNSILKIKNEWKQFLYISQRHWVVLTKKIRQPEHMIE